jgi:uncharacterized protein YkwD
LFLTASTHYWCAAWDGPEQIRLEENMSPQRVLCLSLVILLAAGCAAQLPPASGTPSAIETLEVLPPAVEGAPLIVIVRGRLENNCLGVSVEQIEQSGNQINIFLQTQTRQTENCHGGSFPFESIVSLDPSGLPAGPLTIQAGEVKTQYNPPGTVAQPTPALSSETPAAEPTAPPVEPQANPTPTTPSAADPVAGPTAAATPQTDCINKAAFYDDVTIPDGTALDANQSFTKTWRVRNEGSCSWDSGYALVYASGDLMKAAISNPIPPVAPGEIVDISVQLTAPAQAGAYTGYWQFQAASGETFGVGHKRTGLMWIKIGVRSPGRGQPTASTTPITESCTYMQQSDVEAQVLELINAARSQQGLKAYSLNSQLSKAALVHSIDMACQDFVGHNGSDSSTWNTRITTQGLAYTRASENIYVGNPAFGGSPQGAFDWWMGSQVHRSNILDPAYTKIGIGYVYSAASTYGGYYTLVFSRP